MPESGTRVATGNILPSSFVKLSTTLPYQVTQASTGDKMFGISGPDVNRVPGNLGLDTNYHAQAGGDCRVYITPGLTVRLVLGGTVNPGDRLKSDSSGHGVTTTNTGDWVGAEAQVAGVSGQAIPVTIIGPAEY